MIECLKKLENFFNKIQQRFPASEQGQSTVLVALFLFFAFLAFAALATDGTILYLRRRQLQNMADAAALAAAVELSQTKPITSAYTAAMTSIASNDGRVEWYAPGGTANPPTTNVGSGSGLTAGIEIEADGCTVRVALAWTDIGTYFAQFVGRETLQAGAKARAGCNKSGGLMPIAMKRFGDEFDTTDGPPPPNTNNPNTIYCEDCNTRKSLAAPPPNAQGNGKAFDFFQPEASDQDVIPEWPGWDNPAGLRVSPSPHATNSNPGRKFFFLGEETRPNVGNTSWAGLVNMDIRRPIGLGTVQYYNGVDGSTNSNTLKDIGEYYIRQGYCCDLPVPGDWVAMYNGTSASFSPQALQETYPVGDIIAIIIYNGTVFETPAMEMTGDIPNQKATHPMTTTVNSDVLTYTISLEAIDEFQSASSGLVMDVEGLDGFADWSLSDGRPKLGHGGITQRDIILTITPTLTTTVGMTTSTVVTGTRMFYVSAIDQYLTGVRRYWAGVATIGDTIIDPITGLPVERDLPAVTGTPTNTEGNYPFLIKAKGKQANYNVELNLWAGAGDQDVDVTYIGPPLAGLGLDWGGGQTGSYLGNPVRVTPPPQATVPIKIDVESTATADTTYVLPFLVTADDGYTATFNLYLFVEETESNVDNFVEILGYAAVEIMGYYQGPNLIDPTDPTPPPANSVRGRFVSELQSDPSNLIYGLRARLIPWD